MEIARRKTIDDVFKGWKSALSKKGKRGFWPSFLAGTYISDKNQKARANLQRLKERVYPDKKMKLVRRHGKNVLVEYDTKIKTKADKYFSDDNSLNAITRMLLAGGTRAMRRKLARRLGLRWKQEYLEAEQMIMESKNFSGPGFDGIKAARGIKS